MCGASAARPDVAPVAPVVTGAVARAPAPGVTFAGVVPVAVPAAVPVAVPEVAFGVDPPAGVVEGVGLVPAAGVDVAGVAGFVVADGTGGGVTGATGSGTGAGGAGAVTGGAALAVVVGSAFGDRIHIAIATIPINTTTPTAAAIVQLGFFGDVAGTGAAAVMAFGAVGVGTGCDSAPEAPGALVDPPIGSARVKNKLQIAVIV